MSRWITSINQCYSNWTDVGAEKKEIRDCFNCDIKSRSIVSKDFQSSENDHIENIAGNAKENSNISGISGI